MSKFLNKLCPVCEKRFEEKDDIVVCPECGTPHHRDCYAKNNACGVVAHHIEGFVWKGYLPWEEPELKNNEPEPEIRSTDVFEKRYDNAVASFDSMELDMDKLMREYTEMVDDDRITVDGVSRKELYTFVARSVIHYSSAFEAYRAEPEKKNAKIAVFNFAAGLFKPLHQFYRRMNGMAVLLTLLDVVLALPMLLIYAGVIELTEQNEMMLTMLTSVCNIVSFAVTVLLCIFWNKLYYRHAVKKIKKIRARFHGERNAEYYAALAASGRPSWLNVIVGLLLEMLLVACVIYLPMVFMG